MRRPTLALSRVLISAAVAVTILAVPERRARCGPATRFGPSGWPDDAVTEHWGFGRPSADSWQAFPAHGTDRPSIAPTPSDPSQIATSRASTLSPEERADIFMARKEYADAADYYARALKAANQPQSSQIWNKLGIALEQQMNFAAARRAYKQAIRMRQDFAEPWNNLGTTYYQSGKAKKSIRYYMAATKLNPASAAFHMNLGTALYQTKKTEAAVQEYRTALSLDPRILTTHSTTGTVVQARGTDVEYYFYVAKVFASLNRPDEAVRYLERAMENGFHDMKRIAQDRDLQKLSRYPAYVNLIKTPPVPISD